MLRSLAALFALGVVATCSSSVHAQSQELILDGGFEFQGLGWIVAHDVNPAPSTRGWFLSSVGAGSPLSFFPTSTAGGGSGNYAITDEASAGTMALLQPFTVPNDRPLTNLLLSFDMFVNDWGSQPVFNINQNARVDIVNTNIGAGVPGAADTGVLFNAYVGTDGGPLPNEFEHYEFDILPFVTPGSTYRIRFQTTARVSQLNQGVDNVSILAVPEPATGILAMAAMAVAATVNLRRRKHRRKSA
jgi:hypothetical protein